MPVYVKRYESVTRFIDHVSGPMPEEATENGYRGQEESQNVEYNDRGWTGTRNFGEAIELARKGWPEGRQRAEKLIVELQDQIKGWELIREIVYDVEGLALDVGRFVNGEPEMWMTLVDTDEERETWQPSILRITCNISASGAVGTDTFMARGVAVLALVSLLEARNVRCQIEIVDGTRGSDSVTNFHIVTIKEASEPIQLDQIAFMMAHPSVLRRLFFRAMEYDPVEIRKACMNFRSTSYGTPEDLPEEYRGEVYCGRMFSSRDWDSSFTVAWIKQQLKAQGFTIEEVSE